jgi:hypothetical protein
VQTVIITIRAADFPIEMRDMRIWLDDKGIAPARFDYDHGLSGSIVIKVAFVAEKDAAVFAQRFGGGH